jgi:tetratricopeptide (TPR) repeat protein
MRPKVALLLAALAWSPAAVGQSNTALAETLYQEGKRLMKEKNHASACPKLAESQKLDPAAGTALNLAACYDEWGKYATAWAHYNDALALARREGQDYRVKYAEEQLKAVEKKLTKVQVNVAEVPPGLEVTLDGRVLPAAAFGTPLPVDPGVHVIEATAPGKKTARIEVTADAPKTTVTAEIPALASEDGSGPAAAAASGSPGATAGDPDSPPPAGDPAEDSGSKGGNNTARISGLVVAGLGLVGIGVGTAFYLEARKLNARADVLCRLGPESNSCINDEERSDHRYLVGEAEKNLTLAHVGFGVGAGLVVVGTAIAIIAPGSGGEPEEAAFDVLPAVSPGFAGGSVSGRF